MLYVMYEYSRLEHYSGLLHQAASAILYVLNAQVQCIVPPLSRPPPDGLLAHCHNLGQKCVWSDPQLHVDVLPFVVALL